MNGFELKLENKLQQSLMMTPQLKQAIRLLQLNNLELNDVISQEILENPLIDFEENILNNSKDLINSSTHNEKALSESIESEPQETNFDSIDAENYQNAFDDFGSDKYASNCRNFNEDYNSPSDVIEKCTEEKLNLREKLIASFNLELKDFSEKAIACILIDELDEAGYFRGNVEKIAVKLNTNTNKILSVLDKVKEIAEPAGLFASSLKDCIYYQLKAKDELDESAIIILDNLEILGSKDFVKLKKMTKLSDAQIAKTIEKIKRTDPKPAAGFDIFNPIITPDVIVEKNKSGIFSVKLNEETLPKVLINQGYLNYLETTCLNKDAKRFLAEKLSGANWLIKTLHQRSVNILKVSEEIVKAQQDFFNKGVEYLKPMILMDIAEKTELHESTVSRITSNKYIMTQNGMFELKFFFSQRLTGAYGTKEISSSSVKHKIEAMIKNEGKAILSDDNIAIALNAQGVTIARRTVAKYRESLGIPTSAIRKKTKRDFSEVKI